jgi:hypothetical protein
MTAERVISQEIRDVQGWIKRLMANSHDRTDVTTLAILEQMTGIMSKLNTEVERLCGDGK